MKIEEHVPCSALTTFKVGGVVRYVLTLESSSDARAAVQFAREKQVPLIPFGGGSNVLGRDGVIDVALVRVGMSRITHDTAVDGRMHIDAGAVWDDVVAYAATHTWWGIENLSAIPGTMGGAVAQNIGAYGAVLSDTVVRVTAFDTHTDEVVELSRAACLFGYRTSIYKQSLDRYIVLAATLQLSSTPKPNIEYADIRKTLRDSEAVTLHAVCEAVREVRAQKFPPLDTVGTAGSFFLNPIVTHEEAKEIQITHPTMPVFVLPEGGIKIPLGWLFDHVLALKGYREGNVELWRNQALVVVAHNGATATDVRLFAEKIIARTKKDLHIVIAPEVRFL